MRRREKYTPQYSYHEWLHWEERGELIKGIPVAKSTRIGPKHENAVSEFKSRFTSAIIKAGCKDCHVAEPVDYKITNDTILRPDVFVVCAKIKKTYLDFPPVLVVEVVSKVTEERDRGIKFQLYEQHSVKYYIVADAMKRSIETFELIQGKYELQTYSTVFTFQLSNDCQLSVDFDNVY